MGLYYAEYRFLINGNSDFISHFYSVISTNMGNGLIYELIRDYDGKISLTLNEYIKVIKNKEDNFKNDLPLIFTTLVLII